MAKKDTRGTVAGMLSTAPRPERATPSATTTAVAAVPAVPAVPGAPGAPDPAPTPTEPPLVDPPEPRGAATATGQGGRAPRTLRLSQEAADAVRAAWMDEKRRGDVLLSLQDFASHALLEGIRGRGHTPNP